MILCWELRGPASNDASSCWQWWILYVFLWVKFFVKTAKDKKGVLASNLVAKKCWAPINQFPSCWWLTLFLFNHSKKERGGFHDMLMNLHMIFCWRAKVDLVRWTENKLKKAYITIVMRTNKGANQSKLGDWLRVYPSLCRSILIQKKTSNQRCIGYFYWSDQPPGRILNWIKGSGEPDLLELGTGTHISHLFNIGCSRTFFADKKCRYFV